MDAWFLWQLLRTGDQVEIITTLTPSDCRDYSILSRSSKARNKIRQFFKNQDVELSISKGRELCTNSRHGYVANKYMDKKHME